MRLPVVDDQGRVRWAFVPDDAAGELARPVALTAVVKGRAQFVAVVHAAVYGPKASAMLKRVYKLTKRDMRRLLEAGWGTVRQLESLELAFQNSAGRVRIAGCGPKAPTNE